MWRFWFNRLWEEQCDPLNEYEINWYDKWRKRNPLPPPSPHPKFKGWRPPERWWKEDRRQSSLMTFYLCRPGGIAWSEMPSKTQKYNDMQDPKLKTFEDGTWRSRWRSHAKNFLVKPNRNFFAFDGDGKRGKVVFKSSRPLRLEELVEMIDGVKRGTVSIQKFLTDRET